MTRTEAGARLRDLRLQAGLTQAELGSAIGAKDRAVRDWEHGRVEPRVAVLQRLAAKLGVEVSELGFTGHRSRAPVPERCLPAFELQTAGVDVPMWVAGLVKAFLPDRVPVVVKARALQEAI